MNPEKVKYRSNFDEVDVAAAKNEKVNKMENCRIKSKRCTSSSHGQKDVQSCIKIGMKLHKALR